MDIQDLIQTCDLLPSEDTTRRLLDICGALNKRIDELQSKLARKEQRDAISHTRKGMPSEY